MTAPYELVVVGGGITGLAAAHAALRYKGLDPSQVLLVEGSDRVGGHVRTLEKQGFLLECGPDCFLNEKPQALELVQELGLEQELISTSPQARQSFLVRGQKLLPVPSGLYLLAPARLGPFFGSSILSWPGKLRVAWEMFVPRRPTEDESLASFVRRRLGREALERLAQPMVAGIYAADPEHLSLRATFPKFLEYEARYGSILRGLRRQRHAPPSSGPRYSLFLSFKKGMETLVRALEKKVSHSLKTQWPVAALEQKGPLWHVQGPNREVLTAKRLCLAVPSFIAAKLLAKLDGSLSRSLDSLPYTSVAVVNLAYQQADLKLLPQGAGFVVPACENQSLLACSFSHQKFEGRAPQGHGLLRAFLGGALRPDLPELAESELLARLKKDLQDLLGISGPPLFAVVSRHPSSLPQYPVGHLEKKKIIRRKCDAYPGLALAGSSWDGVGIPDCIVSAQSAIGRLLP